MFSQAMQIGALDNADRRPIRFDAGEAPAGGDGGPSPDVVWRYFVDDNLTGAVPDPQPVPARTGPVPRAAGEPE